MNVKSCEYCGRPNQSTSLICEGCGGSLPVIKGHYHTPNPVITELEWTGASGTSLSPIFPKDEELPEYIRCPKCDAPMLRKYGKDTSWYKCSQYSCGFVVTIPNIIRSYNWFKIPITDGYVESYRPKTWVEANSIAIKYSDWQNIPSNYDNYSENKLRSFIDSTITEDEKPTGFFLYTWETIKGFVKWLVPWLDE